MDYYIIGATFFVWLALCVWGGANLRAHFKSLSFRPTRARVISISRELEQWGDGDRYINHHFRYEYTIDGKEYRGDSSEDMIGYHTSFQKGDLKRGDSVKVYYDPQNPGDSRASRAGVHAGLFLVCFAQLFLALAIKLIRDLG